MTTDLSGLVLAARFQNCGYIFRGLPVPEAITVGGSNILCGPIGLNAGFGGRPGEWKNQTVFCWGPRAEAEVYAFAAEADGVILNADVMLEPDGFLWVDMMLIPHWLKKPTLDRFEITIPLKREIAELCHFWPAGSPSPATGNPANYGGVPPGGLRLPFRPAVWAGNEAGGLGFYMQSDENVLLSDPQSMITIVPDGNAARMTIRLLEGTPPCWAREDRFMERALPPVCFSFGLQATPVREPVKVKGFGRTAHMELKDFHSDPEGTVRELAELGAKWVVLHEDWSMIQNYGQPAHEGQVLRVVELCHEYGLRAIAYFGYEHSTLAPGFFESHRQTCVTDGEGNLMGGWQRDPAQRAYVVCYAGPYRTEMTERVERAMERFGLDGIYTDGTFEPWACANAAHGCGYCGADGQWHVTFPILALRDHVRSLKRSVHARGGIVDAHQSSCCIPPVLGFADSYLDGEHIQPQYTRDIGGFLNARAFRSEFTGENWGIPAQFIVTPAEGRTYEQCCGLPLLHNIDCRPFGIQNVREAARIWRVLDGFGAEEAVFHPYWREGCPVQTGSVATLASCWVRGDRALALVFNTGLETEDILLQYNGKARPLAAASRAPLWIEL